MRVRFQRQALRDLDAIRAYIASDNPSAADRMHTRLRAACEGLADFPYMGRTGSGRTRELTTVRPYVISYLVDADRVLVLKIVHGARLR